MTTDVFSWQERANNDLYRVLVGEGDLHESMYKFKVTLKDGGRKLTVHENGSFKKTKQLNGSWVPTLSDVNYDIPQYRTFVLAGPMQATVYVSDSCVPRFCPFAEKSPIEIQATCDTQ